MRIAHYGTFDVGNFGGLMFPHIAEWRWPEARWVHLSPTSATAPFAGSRPSMGVASAVSERFGAVLGGGGNIVHLGRTPLKEYRDVAAYASPSLWLGANRVAAERAVPFVIKGPSVSHAPPSAVERSALRAVVRRSAYAAFRDEHGVRVAGPARRVPDTAIDVARMWPLDGSVGEDDWLGVHLNLRCAPSLVAAADAIERLASRHRLRVRLLAMGPCHGDVEAAHRKIPVEIVASTSVRAMAHAIGSCRLYVGSSLQGFITALAYGRTASLVLRDKQLPKFLNVLSASCVPQAAIHRSWAEAAGAAMAGYLRSPESETAVRDALDAHLECGRHAARQDPPATRLPLHGAWRVAARLAQAEGLGRPILSRVARLRSAA